MSFCICCGAENINGIHDHDPECLWYEPKMEARGLNKVMMRLLEKNFPVIIEQSIKEYIGVEPIKPSPEMQKQFEGKLPWTKAMEENWPGHIVDLYRSYGVPYPKEWEKSHPSYNAKLDKIED